MISSRRSLASLWIAGDIAALGNWIILVALLAWSYKAKESATTVSILVVLHMLPTFLLGPLAGLVVNRRTARVFAVAAPLLRAVALLPLLVLLFSDDLSLVLTTVFVASIPSAFLRASHSALLRGMVHPDHVASTERVLSATRLLVLVIGPAAGTVIYQSGELRSCAIAAVAALVISALVSILAKPSPDFAPSAEPRQSMADSLAGLLRTLRDPSLEAAVIVRLGLALVTGGLVVAHVAFMIWGIFVSPENIGWMLGAEGLGIAIGMGAGMAVRGSFRYSALIATGLMLIAMGEFGFAIANKIQAAAALMVVAGIGKGVLLPTLASLLPASAGDGSGRPLFFGLGAAAEAMVILSAIAIGPMCDSITPRYTIVLASILLVLLSLYAFASVVDREPARKGEADRAEEQPQVATLLA